jgi:hypothetical protein
MDIQKREEMISFLIRLKKLNQLYSRASEEQKGRLLEASEVVVKKLEGFGYGRNFLIGLIVGGSDFLRSLEEQRKFEGLDASEMSQIIFA